MTDQHVTREADDPTVLIFDLETTGTDTARDEIVEFSAQVGLEPGGESWTCRMRPSRPIPSAATAVHGIRDEDVAACGRFADHAARIRAMLTGADVLVGYNLSFDLSILDAELERSGLPPLDLSHTLIVDAYALWRSEEPRTLTGAHERFVGEPFDGAHSAAGDVAATGRVLAAMLRAFGLANEPWDTISERSEPGRRRWIGPTRHVEWRAGVPVFTFGKHRGRALDAIAQEEEGDYLRWVAGGRFPPHVKRIARLALELDPPHLRHRLATDYGAPPPPDGPRRIDPPLDPPPSPVEPVTPVESVEPAEPVEPETPDARPEPASSPRRGAARPASGRPVVLFDGVCNLCQGWVKFVISRDRKDRFRFASLQSEVAQELVRSHPEAREADSILLVEGDRVHARSAAALRILRGLGGAWALAYALWIVPRPIRDAVYDLVARHRYRWFGRQESCMIPTPGIRARFLDQD